jgi:hypothetical protein
VNPGDTISGEMKQNRWGFHAVFREASKGEIPSHFLVFSYYPLPNSTKFHGIVRAFTELGFLVGFHGDLIDWPLMLCLVTDFCCVG